VFSVSKSSSIKRRGLVQSSSQVKPRSVIRARGAGGQEAGESKYSTSSAYLIDRMFQQGGPSVGSHRRGSDDGAGTEYDMYREAVKFDTGHAKLSQISDLSNKWTDNSIKLNKSSDKSDTCADKHGVNVKKTKEKSKEVVTVQSKTKKSSNKESLSVPKEEDKLSETGTYTIEDEKDSRAEDEARRNIDRVFGVDQVSLDGSTGDNLSDDIKEQLLHSDKQGELTLNLVNLNLELAEIEALERHRAFPNMADSLEAELGSVVNDTGDDTTPEGEVGTGRCYI